MTYEKIVENVKKALSKVDATGVNGHLAVQVDIYGEGEGAFYIEVKDGKVNVEPYDYHDNWATVTVAPTNLFKILDGKMDAVAAYTSGKVEISGDVDTVLRFVKLAK